MALPVVKTLADCSDFFKTVYPFTSQLSALPQQLLDHATDVEGLKNIYVSTNPLVFAFALSLVLAPIFLVVSEINRNYSQVDRCWSILPTMYIAHYAIWARLNDLPTQRIDNVLAFAVVWSARLTFNYWRKGGYSIGSEDYRWEVLRDYIHPALFFIFNVLFISLAQSVLLFMVTTPTYILLLTAKVRPAMEMGDIILARVLMGLVLVEFFADQQQWTYQNAKKQYQTTAKPPQGYTRAQMDRGFVTTGLWAFSRHPNFAAEQAVWCCLYQWSCYATYALYNWTFVGAMSYLILFQASTWFTEIISSRKYPEYSVYQERVGKFVPKLVGKGWDEKEMETMGPQISKTLDAIHKQVNEQADAKKK